MSRTGAERGKRETVKVSVEVRSGNARFRVGVRAQSIGKALSLVAGSYPRGVVRVAFPIEPEGFFVREPSAPARVLGHEQFQKEVA
jgi:hypothetical protein